MILAKPLWGTVHEWSLRHNVALHYTMALIARIVVIIFVCRPATLNHIIMAIQDLVFLMSVHKNYDNSYRVKWPEHNIILSS